MRIRRTVATLSAVLVLAACTQEVRGVASAGPASGAPSTTSSAPAPSPTSPSPAPDQQPPDPPSGSGDTADKAGPAQPGAADDPAGAPRVTGLRFQSDSDSAQLVVDLSGSGVPEWTVGYSEATGPGGEPVDIAGDAFLRVRVRSEAGGGNQGSSRVAISPGPVAEAQTTGTANGYDEVLIGIRGGEQPFSVAALTDPGRLVLEIRQG